MKHGQLRDYFNGVGAKRLSAVDAELVRSNQHEVGTTRDMRDQFLGDDGKRNFPVVYIWLGGEQNAFTVEGNATHYDAREGQPKRSAEWRLYYPSNTVTEAMREGDALFLALDTKGTLFFIVAAKDSTSEHQLSWLFGLQPHSATFVSREVQNNEPELDFAAHFIFDEIGVAFEDPDAYTLDSIIEPFGTSFPTTVEFSDLARCTLPEVNPRDDPDAALVAWLSHEEALFRRLERRIVAERLEQGFVDANRTDVDGFIKFSLSVQNRRKSRMGYSLENHLEAIFRAYELAYVRGGVTENNQRPDFLFPSLQAYAAAPAEGCGHLTMLGAKSTCRDRWRQVLVEASKIPRKHLLTLEPSISVAQTAQMFGLALQLVVPQSIHATYTDPQQKWLWCLDDFIREVKRAGGEIGYQLLPSQSGRRHFKEGLIN